MPFDYSKLSDADLEAVANGDLSKVSDEGLQHIAAFDQKKEELINSRKKSGYDGIPDEQLNFVQKAERFLQPPGHPTMFDPKSMEAKKKALPLVAGGVGAAAAATAFPAAIPALLKYVGVPTTAGALGNAVYRRLFGNK